MKHIKIAFIVICITGAGVILWLNGSGEGSIPDTAESSTNWMCNACKHVFPLTVSEAAREEKRAGGPPPFICPSCSAKEAYRVAQCETCSTYYFSLDVPGSLGRCPTCFPLNTPNMPNPHEESETEEEKSPPSV